MRFWKPPVVKSNAKVGIGVAAYVADDRRLRHALRCLVASFQAQTYDNWRMLVVHDGPVSGLELCVPVDQRVVTRITDERLQKFGHPHRQQALDALRADCDWVLLTNQDNYYAPPFLHMMLHAAQAKAADLVFCDAIHSHKKWKLMVTELRRGHVDLGAVMARTELARKVKFDNFSFAGDWDYISRLAAAAKKRTAKVPAPLFVHN